jgi:DNA-binding NtrC family response regulator
VRQGSNRPRNERSLLLVEDDISLLQGLRRYLRRTYIVYEAQTLGDAMKILEQNRIDVMVVDVMLPDGRGWDLADKAQRLTPTPGVVMTTGHEALDNAISAIHHGAADFLLKPFSFAALDAALARAQGLELESPDDGADPTTLEWSAWRDKYASEIVGSTAPVADVLRVLQRVAGTEVTVLITGESGTGKELAARALHFASRPDKPFVVVNCAAIPRELLESELFGHIKGSFTGATADRLGHFTAANDGTIFLDEIGDMPVELQAKLLRVLQERQVTPIGSSASHKINVRVVAATNRDLEQDVFSGRFREDLLYRLNVIQIELPPLRGRRADIPELARRLVARVNERRGNAIEGISDRAINALAAYDWPGNIRQLENTIERMAVLRGQGVIDVEDLPRKLVRATPPTAYSLWAPTLPEKGVDLPKAVEAFENAFIMQALERTGWNKNKAAALLNLNRTTLVEKLKRRELLNKRG